MCVLSALVYSFSHTGSGGEADFLVLSLTHCFLLLPKVPLPLHPNQSPGTQSLPWRGFSSVSSFCMNSVIPGHEHNTHLKRFILKHKVPAPEVPISILIEAILQCPAETCSGQMWIHWCSSPQILQWKGSSIPPGLDSWELLSVQGTQPGFLCVHWNMWVLWHIVCSLWFSVVHKLDENQQILDMEAREFNLVIYQTETSF